MQVTPVNYDNQSRNKSFGNWMTAEAYGEKLIKEGKINQVGFDRALDRILDSSSIPSQRPNASIAKNSSNTKIDTQA